MNNNSNGNCDKHLELISERMQDKGLPKIAIETFQYYYRQLVEGESGLIDQTMIDPVTEAPDLERLPDHTKTGKAALREAVIINLNGGLGTSMGLAKAKSLLPAKDGNSFLDIIAKQVLYLRESEKIDLPAVFMNSFRTDDDTLGALDKFPALKEGQPGISLSFLQNQVPKILQDNFSPAEWPKDPSLEWCPPGHGDIYTAMSQSGLLDSLLKGGYRYAFVSNSDNLGALMDTQVLGYFVDSKASFMMEVADRTEADKKGGHIATGKNGRIVLRDSAQCPPEEVDDFQNISKYRYFNTNSLWIDLKALKVKLEETNYILGLPLVRNSKTVDPRDPSSPKVYQLETVMGTAISLFDNALALRVPRTRFAPVKTTNDLLDLWSDIFVLNDRAEVKPNPKRTLGKIVVDLDSEYYKRIDDFEKRFPYGAPSLIDCESLTVKGDVRFGKNVVLRGKVVLTNENSEPLIIQDGELIES